MVDKSARRLMLMQARKPVFSMAISPGKNPLGQKEREGDGARRKGLID